MEEPPAAFGDSQQDIHIDATRIVISFVNMIFGCVLLSTNEKVPLAADRESRVESDFTSDKRFPCTENAWEFSHLQRPHSALTDCEQTGEKKAANRYMDRQRNMEDKFRDF